MIYMQELTWPLRWPKHGKYDLHDDLTRSQISAVEWPGWWSYLYEELDGLADPADGVLSWALVDPLVVGVYVLQE